MSQLLRTAAAGTRPPVSSADPGTESLPLSTARVPRLPAELLPGLLVRGPVCAGHLRHDELSGEQPGVSATAAGPLALAGFCPSRIGHGGRIDLRSQAAVREQLRLCPRSSVSAVSIRGGQIKSGQELGGVPLSPSRPARCVPGRVGARSVL